MKKYIIALLIIFSLSSQAFASSINGCENLRGTTWYTSNYRYVIHITGVSHNDTNTGVYWALSGFLDHKEGELSIHKSFAPTGGINALCATDTNGNLNVLQLTDGTMVIWTAYVDPARDFNNPLNPTTITMAVNPGQGKKVEQNVIFHKQ